MDEVSRHAKILALESVVKGLTELLSTQDRKRLTSYLKLELVDYEERLRNSYTDSFEERIYIITL